MSKTLCDLKKALKKDIDSFLHLIDAPTHVCRKCGRVANKKKLICKPKKLK